MLRNAIFETPKNSGISITLNDLDFLKESNNIVDQTSLLLVLFLLYRSKICYTFISGLSNLRIGEGYGNRNRGNTADTAVITAAMGTNQENRAVIPR